MKKNEQHLLHKSKGRKLKMNFGVCRLNYYAFEFREKSLKNVASENNSLPFFIQTKVELTYAA